jgi:predicted CoA-binding protein
MEMTSKAVVDDFLGQKTMAVVGVSRGGKKFGNAIMKDLKEKGYRVFPINPNAETIDGERCYPSLEDLPERPGAVITVVPPAATENVVREAKAAGIERVWMQQGSESETAIRYCQENGIEVVHGECILMFAEPVGSVHRFHRWIWKIFGKLPR